MQASGFAFGPYVVLPSRRELLREGRPVSLPPKAFDTLIVLLEHHDRVVSKHELLGRLWPDTSVSEASLTQQVFLLRRALNGDSAGEEYVATVARHGYRFVAAVHEAAGDTMPTDAHGAPRRWRPLGRLNSAAAVVVVVVALGVGGYFLVLRQRSAGLVSGTFVQLTSEPGVEAYPSLSPDGSWIVYAAGPLDYPAPSDIYLRGVGDRQGINLTADSGHTNTQPVFSPDGTEIAFRSNGDGGGLFVMRRSGESVRRLTTFGFNPSWSPDGSRLAFSTQSVAADPIFRGATPAALWVVDRMGSASARIGRGLQPSWSPHGFRIAFVEAGAVWTMKPDGADVRKLTSRWGAWNPAWSPDGRWLYFSGPHGDTMNLWRLPVDEARGRATGKPVPLDAPTIFAGHLSVSADGHRVAFASIPAVANIRHFEFDPAAERVVAERDPITRGSWTAVYPAVSPDGRRIAFHTGLWREDIYVTGSDGSQLRQLTDDDDADRGARWSPDGARLSFFSNRGGSWNTWIVNSEGTGLRRVTSGPPTLSLVWAPDGVHAAIAEPPRQAYLFEPDRSDRQRSIDRLPPLPGGGFFQPQAWTTGPLRLAGGGNRDGRPLGTFVWFAEQRRYEQVSSIGAGARWLPDGRRLMVAADARLLVVDTVTHEIRQILSLAPDRVAGPSGGSFDLSPDGRHIYVSPLRRTGDIWMLQQ